MFAKSIQKAEEPKETEDRGKRKLVDVLNLHLEMLRAREKKITLVKKHPLDPVCKFSPKTA